MQFVYSDSAATSRVTHGGCTVTSWDGTDSDGMAGPPWVSYVNCSKGASYNAKGVATNGDFQIWLHQPGQLSMNGEVLSHMGESFWLGRGAQATIKIEGTAYVAGAKFELDPSAAEATSTSAFVGPRFRRYAYADAVANTNAASLQHDPHICNGSSPSKDFVFGSQTHVDPPSVSVLNCAPSSNPAGNFVWSHFHPFGALYIPLSGEICFASKDVICVGPGTARWTSANLMYYEYFRKINTTNVYADAVRDLGKVPADRCQFPNLFAVTNFDGSSRPAGVPNFDDWPVNAHKHDLALGIGPWGVFSEMVIQATKVVVKTSSVDDSDEEEARGAPILM